MSTIVAEQLVKTYGEVRAVDGVSLRVERGELYGFLGPNGAGKTTTISILSTMLKPTSGAGTVAGFDVLKQPSKVREKIGVVFQDPSLDEELTARENMMFHARLYKVPRSQRDRRIDDLLAMVDLTARARKGRVKEFSGGMRRRLELARGLLHEPDVLFLDEPTLGLDPQTRSHIWEYIRRLNKERSVTMLLTTHYMEEADELCNRIGIIDRGKIVAEGTPTQLKAGLGGDVVYLQFNGSKPPTDGLFAGIPEVRRVQEVDQGLQLEVERGDTAIPRILDAVRAKGGTVTSINMKRPSLNDVFMKHTGHGIRDEEMDHKGRMSFYMRGRRR